MWPEYIISGLRATLLLCLTFALGGKTWVFVVGYKVKTFGDLVLQLHLPLPGYLKHSVALAKYVCCGVPALALTLFIVPICYTNGSGGSKKPETRHKQRKKQTKKNLMQPPWLDSWLLVKTRL